MLDRLADRLEILNLYVKNSKHEPLLHSVSLSLKDLVVCKHTESVDSCCDLR